MTTFPLRQSHPPIRPVAIQEMLARVPAAGHNDTRAALVRLGEAYSTVHATTARYMADATLTPAARMVRSARAARTTLAPAIEALRAARNAAAESRANLIKQTAKPFDYQGDFPATMIAAEIRSHFASLPSAQRLNDLRAAIEAGDTVTMKAVGTGPAFLAGLPPAMHAQARDALIDLHPDARASRDAAKAFDEQAELAAQIETVVLQATANMIDFVEADSFALAAQDAVAS